MSDSLQFNYYYGIEAEQFSFYRVPRLLIKDKRFKGLSSDAKLLYGLMLDRMSLSMKNGWLDKENRAYIHYTVENIMEDLGCSRGTCIKILAELDSKKGIGLIEKKRQGLGRPDIIYVKNFVIVEPPQEPKKEEEPSENPDKSTEVQILNAERAIPHFQKENWGMLVADEDAKTHLLRCEATCVHEEVAKRIPNVCFTYRRNVNVS